MSPILVTLMSHSDSNFEQSNINFKENKPDGVDRTLTVSNIAFERKKEELHGFRQTEYCGWRSAVLWIFH